MTDGLEHCLLEDHLKQRLANGENVNQRGETYGLLLRKTRVFCRCSLKPIQ